MTSLPQGSCDAHVHIFGPRARFPFAATRAYTPDDVPVPALRALHDRLGISRCVLVQSAAHGFDHAAVMEAMSLHPGRYRAVGRLDPAATPAQLAALDAGGMRGVRINYLPHLGHAPDDDAVRLAASRVAPLGWHLALHVDGPTLAARHAFFQSLPVPLVIDHMARVDGAQGPSSPGFTALRRLLQTGRIWVKLSGADRVSRQPYPHQDAIDLAAILLNDAPERCVWGTDFPHVNITGPMPDDAALLALVDRIAPTPGQKQRLLADNPAALYGFAALPATR